MKYNEIRNGNLLRYMGHSGKYYNRIGIVESIDPTRDGKDSFELLVNDWQNKTEQIRAYQEEVWPITLDVSHLEILGFVKDKEHNIFRKDGLIIFRPIFIKFFEDHHEYIDKGFVVVNKPMSLPISEDLVESSTTSVTSLHTFQNYLNEIGWNNIDWTIFIK